jgi:hypothetical protein
MVRTYRSFHSGIIHVASDRTFLNIAIAKQVNVAKAEDSAEMREAGYAHEGRGDQKEAEQDLRYNSGPAYV